MEKTINYTAEQTAELVTAYTADPTVATILAFATKFGKTTKSIVAKLVRENAYVSKAKAAPGAKRVTKAGLIGAIEGELDLPAGSLNSLEKASLDQLKVLAAKVVFQQDHVDA